jgi:CRP-like cAMP-binding protein
MSPSRASQRNRMASKNMILDSLPQADYEWLLPKLEKVELRQGSILYQPRERIADVYFPMTCLLSWTNLTEAGAVVEVGITGHEGLAGVTLLLGEEIAPWQIEVQLSGLALKLPAENFVSALKQSAALRQRVASFAYVKIVQLSQSAVCNRFHNVEERLCRWLLEAQDHSETPHLALTQEILAQMIGAGRPSVSITLGSLQSAGLIRANRGEITILNRAAMEATSCECYQVVREALDRYLVKRIEV